MHHLPPPHTHTQLRTNLWRFRTKIRKAKGYVHGTSLILNALVTKTENVECFYVHRPTLQSCGIRPSLCPPLTQAQDVYKVSSWSLWSHSVKLLNVLIWHNKQHPGGKSKSSTPPDVELSYSLSFQTQLTQCSNHDRRTTQCFQTRLAPGLTGCSKELGLSPESPSCTLPVPVPFPHHGVARTMGPRKRKDRAQPNPGLAAPRRATQINLFSFFAVLWVLFGYSAPGILL